MTLLEAIEARHSVRKYKDEPIPDDVLTVLRNKVWEINKEDGLHLCLYFRFSVSSQSRCFSLPGYFPESTWDGSSEQSPPSRRALGQLLLETFQRLTVGTSSTVPHPGRALGCSPESTQRHKVFVRVFGLRMY